MNHSAKQIETNLQSLAHGYKGNSWNLLQQSIKLTGFDLKSVISTSNYFSKVSRITGKQSSKKSFIKVILLTLNKLIFAGLQLLNKVTLQSIAFICIK